MKRRTFLSLSSITALALIAGCEAKETYTIAKANNTLPIPELLKPTLTHGVHHYNLNIQEAKHTFFDGAVFSNRHSNIKVNKCINKLYSNN